MMRATLFTAGLVALAACGRSGDVEMPFGPYVDLAAGPDRLRSDFNAHAGEVRLLFIVGPT